MTLLKVYSYPYLLILNDYTEWKRYEWDAQSQPTQEESCNKTQHSQSHQTKKHMADENQLEPSFSPKTPQHCDVSQPSSNSTHHHPLQPLLLHRLFTIIVAPPSLASSSHNTRTLPVSSSALQHRTKSHKVIRKSPPLRRLPGSPLHHRNTSYHHPILQQHEARETLRVTHGLWVCHGYIYSML